MSIEGVDLVITNKQKEFIDKILSAFFSPKRLEFSSFIPHPSSFFFCSCITRFDGQTRALVKIEDGCDSFCTYCIIPYVRGGKIISRPADSIIQEIKNLALNGHKEIVLTGIHLGAYGRDIEGNMNLAAIVKLVHEIEGIERIRLSSIEPMDISEELILEASRLPKFAHHFHIPLQSGSDKILHLMNRNYTPQDFDTIIAKIRAAIPDAGISTDVMVGFPGENESDFEDTYNLATRLKFSRMHVFRYSPREGTPAAKFPDQVPSYVSALRSQRLISLAEQLAKDFHAQMLGQRAEVLVEDTREGKNSLLAGFTSNYVRALISDATEDMIGQILAVRLVDIEDEYIIGSIVE